MTRAMADARQKSPPSPAITNGPGNHHSVRQPRLGPAITDAPIGIRPARTAIIDIMGPAITDIMNPAITDIMTRAFMDGSDNH